MLYYKREKLATNIATAMVPVLQAVFRSTGRTDAQLFDKSFLSGFLSGSCFALAAVFSGQPLSPRDTGDIQVRVLRKLVGEQWQVVSDYVLKYIKLGDADCVRGSEAAQGFWAVSYGLIDLDSDSLLRRFREKAKSVPQYTKDVGLAPPQDENEAVASLMMTHILEEITEGKAWDAN